MASCTFALAIGFPLSQDDAESVWYALNAPSLELTRSRGANLKLLAHYTSFAALKGIVEHNELWFSPVASMNDWDEIRRGKRLLMQLSEEGAPLDRCFSEIRSVNGHIWDRLNAAFAGRLETDFDHTFVSCWTEAEKLADVDELAMWRGYGGDGNGVAIVIDPVAAGFGSETGGEIISCAVEYETPKEFSDRSCAVLEGFWQRLQKLDERLVQEQFHVVESAFAELCFYLAVTHKHPGFKLEREWRLVWRRHLDVDGVLAPLVRSEVSSRGLYEYLCLPLEDNPHVLPTPIDPHQLVRAVLIGPTEDAASKAQAVRQLLYRAGFDPQLTTVSTSAIPYRSTR